MTYTGITEAELKTLHQFAAALGIKLEEINGCLGFTDDRSETVFRRDITKELIKEVTVKPDYLGQWDDRMEIDLNAGGCFYTLFFTRPDSVSECSLDLKHTHPMAFQAGLKLPQQVIEWALERAR